ncbi:MAG: T9SS type A sorting domain-containing protein, partial [Bacteroidales bacterium]|nr:T9SS type A sorting domain-containing protein [Bacteroidales bacterium]
TTPTWKMYQYDLSAYVNETCLHLALEAGSYAGGDQNIDRIQIQVEQDVEVSEFQLSDTLNACDLKGRELSVVLTNATMYDVNYDRPDSIYLHVELMKPDSSITSLKKVLRGRLLANTADTMSVISGYNFDLPGSYHFRAYVDTVTFTTDVTNDTLDMQIDVLPDLAVVAMDSIGNHSMGDVVRPTVYVVNSGNLTAEKVELRMKVNDENDIVEVSNTPLKAGDTLKYTFSQGFTVPEVDPDQPYYFLSIESEMSCDMDATNNVYEYVGGVNLIDLSVYSIQNPKASGFGCDSGRKELYVNIDLYNYSDVAVDTATVHVVVDSAGVKVFADFTEKVTNIPVGNLNKSLSTPYVVPNYDGKYNVTVYVEQVNGEMNYANDTVRVEACAIYNDVAVPGFDGDAYSLGQNIPNPARTATVIPFSIPEDANVTLTVMSVSGQMLYTTEISATAGENSYDLNVENLSAGIYYYTMEYKGQRLVRKMNVVK